MMAVDVPLQHGIRFGFPAHVGSPTAARRAVELAEHFGYDALGHGDHLSFAQPIDDPLIELATVAGLTRKLTLYTMVYLLPLRHPATVAKQVATLDRMAEGRLVFAVGVGGEFPAEFALAGVPLKERGPRLTEGIEVLRKLWSGETVSHQGRFYSFPAVQMLPTPTRAGGPPIWCGGRSEAALRRAGRMADGYISYVVTPSMFREALQEIARAAAAAKRQINTFGTGHLLFTRMGETREEALDHAARYLSERYAMDFRKAAERYCALGRPADIAATIAAFHQAGVRNFMLDMLGRASERDTQLQKFAEEVMPLLTGLA
jgi:probable F420-dependent oxidoreductase